jgi:hypothetical protein
VARLAARLSVSLAGGSASGKSSRGAAGLPVVFGAFRASRWARAGSERLAALPRAASVLTAPALGQHRQRGPTALRDQ